MTFLHCVTENLLLAVASENIEILNIKYQISINVEIPMEFLKLEFVEEVRIK